MPRYDYSAMTGPEITRRRDEIIMEATGKHAIFGAIKYETPEMIHESRLLDCRTMANACILHGHPEQFIREDGGLAKYARQFTNPMQQAPVPLTEKQKQAWRLNETEIRTIFKNQKELCRQAVSIGGKVRWPIR